MMVRCPWCDKIVRARNPRGGDGSGVRAYRHLVDGETCRGSYSLLELSDTIDPHSVEESDA